MVNPLLLVVPLLVLSMVTGELEVHFEWKYIDYVWKNAQHKQDAIDSGTYNASHVVTIDIDRIGDGRTFVTTPRIQTGVPASLSTITNNIGGGGHKLKPYPDWSWHTVGNCTNIISVFRVTTDNCNRLWVLDTGKIGEEKICPAKLLVFNLANNRLVKRVEIPSDISENENSKGLLITPVVETHGHFCEHTTVYMADVDGHALVVYNGWEMKRYTDPSFTPDLNHADFTIVGESFHLEDGLFTLALEPEIRNSHPRRLVYRPLASLKQYYVSTKYFQRNLNGSDTPNYHSIDDYEFPSQVTMQAFSRSGILFMGLTNPPALACWNSRKPMTSENVVIVAQDDKTLQFISGMKIRGNQLWLTTNRFQKIMAGTQNFEELNYYGLTEPNINNLVRNTACASST